MNPMSPPRTVIHNGITYKVVRLYSSGLGVQYACTTKSTDDKETTTLISESMTNLTPDQIGLLQACARRYDDALTFAKYLGSSTFWQSQLPPDGITKPDPKLN